MRPRRIFRFCLGLLLLPTSCVAVAATAKALGAALENSRQNLPFLVGFCAYPCFQWILFRPARLYVLAHELTHAMAACFSGIRIRKISVSKNRGHVLLSKTNAFVALAPYCVPFYTLLLLVLLFGAGRFLDLRPYAVYLVGAVGFTLAFHFFLTADILWSHRQSDLSRAGGAFFSLVVIILANCLVLAVCLKIFFPRNVSIKSYLGTWAEGTLRFWAWTLEHAWRLVARNQA